MKNARAALKDSVQLLQRAVAKKSRYVAVRGDGGRAGAQVAGAACRLRDLLRADRQPPLLIAITWALTNSIHF